MTRLLITGGTGFIGEPAVRLARERFGEVHAAARSPGAVPGVRYHRCDLLASGAAAQLVEAIRPTHLLHLAWIATPGAFWTAPENHRWVEASQQLLFAFARCGGTRVVFAGTCAEYDWAAGGVCREFATLTRPQTLYGKCKQALAGWATTFGRSRRVGVSWARLFWMYGPREHPARLVPSVARAVLAGVPAPQTAGAQRRDFLHVEDVASALVALTASELTGPVNVGSGEAVAVRTVVGTVARACGRPELVPAHDRPTPAGEPPLVVADTARLRDELGWRPRFDLAAGLEHAVEWWRSAGSEGASKCA